MVKNRKTFLAVACFIAVIAMLCSGTMANAQDDRAKPRDRNQKQAERKRESPPPRAREPQAQRRNRDQDNRTARDDASRRRPRPDEQYTRPRSRESRESDRYHWRNYERRSRSVRDRFPRFYFGITIFRDARYYGGVFGPHYGFWHRDGRMFFWPYSYQPRRGCGWYYVPRDRRLFVDPYSRFEEWEYWDYDRLYICFD